jgi:hypothetical protein
LRCGRNITEKAKCAKALCTVSFPLYQTKPETITSTKINGKNLLAIGFQEGKAIGTALTMRESAYKGKIREHKPELLSRGLESRLGRPFYCLFKAVE